MYSQECERRTRAQAQGALKTLARQAFWCQHPRRGRVDFSPGSITITHVLVLTELIGDVVELPDDFTLSIGSTPVVYLSVNDFFNLISELRTIPDITHYLEEHLKLPDRTRRLVGGENPLYQYYVFNDDSFTNCCGYEDARIVSAARRADFKEYVQLKPLRDRYAGLVECVSDRLAERLQNYTQGLDLGDLTGFDDPANRRQYPLALVRSGPVGLSKNDQREEQAWEGEDRLLGGDIIHAEGVRQ